MTEVGSIEASEPLFALLDRAEHGEEIVITRDGRPVAKLVPFPPDVDRRVSELAARRLRARAASKGRGRFDWEEWKGYRDEDRP